MWIHERESARASASLQVRECTEGQEGKKTLYLSYGQRKQDEIEDHRRTSISWRKPLFGKCRGCMRRTEGLGKGKCLKMGTRALKGAEIELSSTRDSRMTLRKCSRLARIEISDRF
eukprot:6088750-Pleurochrysis_carterae.AAC.1